MKSLLRALPLLALATSAVAQSASAAVYPTNTTIVSNSTIPTLNNTIVLWTESGGRIFSLQPLTESALDDLQSQPARAENSTSFLYTTDETQRDNLTNSSIAYVSCDPSYYPGQLGVADVVNDAINSDAFAIVFYSYFSAYCNISQTFGNYPYFYTMVGAYNSQDLLSYLSGFSKGTNAGTQAYIMTQNEYNQAVKSQQYGPLGIYDTGVGRKTTAIAMIALYAVTGVITILFLCIIITGAVRAHRHPERYGPRNIIGRPRQSRAKGIARAMLDTLPIVKFGEAEPAKHGDVEMTDTGSVAAEEGRASHDRTAPTQHANTGKANETTEQERALAGSKAETDGASSSEALPVAGNIGEDGQMCSICTDEFERGEDIRLLPCKHMFHPACVDPWLLDVSGTCPLCRINLNPEQPSEAAASDAPADDIAPTLAPPLDPTASSGRRANVLRTLFGERSGHSTQPQRLSPQETLAALRRHREANRNRHSQLDPATREQEQQEEQTRRRRFFSRGHRASRS